MDKADARKLVFGSLLAGMSALPMGSFVAGAAGIAGGVGGNWVAEALGGVLAAPAPGLELGKVYERALRRAVNELRRDYQREFGRIEEPSAFALLSDSSTAIVTAEPVAGASSVGEVQTILVRGLDDILYGHNERQVAHIKAQILERSARAFQEELASDPEAWRLFQGWLLQRLLQNSAQLQAEVSRIPALLARLEASVPPLQDLDAMADQLDRELAAIRAELQRIAAGADAGTTRSSVIDFGNNNKIGTITIGDVAGRDIHKTSGPLIFGDIHSGRDANIAGGNQTINNDEQRKPPDSDEQ